MVRARARVGVRASPNPNPTSVPCKVVGCNGAASCGDLGGELRGEIAAGERVGPRGDGAQRGGERRVGERGPRRGRAVAGEEEAGGGLEAAEGLRIVRDGAGDLVRVRVRVRVKSRVRVRVRVGARVRARVRARARARVRARVGGAIQSCGFAP